MPTKLKATVIISSALVLMGVTSIFAQVLLLRELLVTFLGNELTIGIIISNWILLQALGSGAISKILPKNKLHLEIYAFLQIFIAFSLPLTIVLCRLPQKIMHFSPGEAIGLLQCFLFSLISLAPVACCAGLQFPLAARIYSKSTAKEYSLSAGKTYALEALGFFIGGLIITFFLIPRFNSITIAFIAALLNAVSAFFLIGLADRKRRVKQTLLLIFPAFISGALILGLSRTINESSLKEQWKPSEVTDYRNSIYGNIAVTKKEGQYTLFYNGNPLFTIPSPDIASQEDLAHFPLFAHPRPEDILVISSASAGLLWEILKHPGVKTLSYVELDPEIIRTIKKIPSPIIGKEFSDPRVTVINTDPRKFMRETREKYDIILLNAPAPSTLEINRLYTLEFFETAARKLNREGLFILKIPATSSAYDNYLTDINACIIKTAQNVLTQVLIIPGETNIILLSNSTISLEKIPQRFLNLRIDTKNFTLPYLKYRISEYWQEWLKKSLIIPENIMTNRDFHPSGVFYALQLANAKISHALAEIIRASLKFILPALITILLSLVFHFRRRGLPGAASFCVLTSGLASMSLSIIIILSYQTLIGCIYEKIGLLIACFMAGIFLGARAAERLPLLNPLQHPKKVLLISEAGFIVFMLFILALLEIARQNPGYARQEIFFILSLVSGLWLGMEFTAANRIFPVVITKESYSDKLYALDLSASAGAALLTPVFFIPLFGLPDTIAGLLILKTISLLLLNRAGN